MKHKLAALVEGVSGSAIAQEEWAAPLNSCLSLQKGEVPPIFCWTPPPTSWQVTFQLVPRLRREDATTSYLPSSPRLPPFPPCSPQVDTRPQPSRLTVSPTATLPWRRRTRTEKAKTGLIVPASRKFCGGGERGGRIRGVKWLKSLSAKLGSYDEQMLFLLYWSQILMCPMNLRFFFMMASIQHIISILSTSCWGRTCWPTQTTSVESNSLIYICCCLQWSHLNYDDVSLNRRVHHIVEGV